MNKIFAIVGARSLNTVGRLRRVVTLLGQIWAYATLKRVTWLESGNLAVCRFPRSDAALQELALHGVRLIVNLHEQPNPADRMARYGMTELHLPVRDLTAPTPEQLERGVEAIEGAMKNGTRVAVHCGAGLGRTGTLVACYLVRKGLSPDDAIAHIRALRPGSIESLAQEAAVRSFGQSGKDE